MNQDFLIRPAQLDKAFESNGSSGGGESSAITRRSFIKRTGGATVATLVAWNLATNNANAAGPPGNESHCPTHGSYCNWIKSVKVKFDGVLNPHPQPTHPERSGRVFTGKLSYVKASCDGTPDVVVINISVTSGGFLVDNPHLVQGENNDTSCPGGLYDLNLTPAGDILGFDLIPQPPHRSAVELHDRQRPQGSSGCIAFTDKAGENGPWDTFNDLMLKNKKPCPHSPPNPVPLTVEYAEGFAPNYAWTPGHVATPPCNNCH